jgi:hypothetical protein
LITVEASIAEGKVADFQLWRNNVVEATNDFQRNREECLKIQNRGDRILCLTGNIRSFLDIVEALRKDLDDLTIGSEVGQDFVNGIRECLGRT